MISDSADSELAVALRAGSDFVIQIKFFLAKRARVLLGSAPLLERFETIIFRRWQDHEQVSSEQAWTHVLRVYAVCGLLDLC
jgi:hypothetical protein